MKLLVIIGVMVILLLSAEGLLNNTHDVFCHRKEFSELDGGYRLLLYDCFLRRSENLITCVFNVKLSQEVYYDAATWTWYLDLPNTTDISPLRIPNNPIYIDGHRHTLVIEFSALTFGFHPFITVEAIDQL